MVKGFGPISFDSRQQDFANMQLIPDFHNMRRID